MIVVVNATLISTIVDGVVLMSMDFSLPFIRKKELYVEKVYVTGELTDDRTFKACDTIRVIDSGK